MVTSLAGGVRSANCARQVDLSSLATWLKLGAIVGPLTRLLTIGKYGEARRLSLPRSAFAIRLIRLYLIRRRLVKDTCNLIKLPGLTESNTNVSKKYHTRRVAAPPITSVVKWLHGYVRSKEKRSYIRVPKQPERPHRDRLGGTSWLGW